MQTLSELTRLISPQRTVLFLGAGASVPSGAPTGSDLAAMLWKALAKSDIVSEDLTETCSILENRYGRNLLVEEVRTILKKLQPSGGLLAIPEFEWNSIYTTNFDTLVESAYRRCGKLITPVRSNFDYGRAESSEGIPLFKIHGCVTQDLVDGHKGRMVLSERDYEEYKEYRDTLFRRLDLDLSTKDVLVIGHSLRDPHLRQAMNQAAELHQKKGAPGRLFALIYQNDPDRAQLLERRGYTLCFGGVDEFLFHLAAAQPPAPTSQPELPGIFSLPALLRAATLEISHANTLTPNAVRLFNGSPATYADIANGMTIKRSVEERILSQLTSGERYFQILLGVAGVGKTTLARRLLASLSNNGILAWEHRSDFPFKAGEWIEIERRLRETKLKGVLLIDECAEFLRQVNLLAESLAKTEEPSLLLILTANNTQWLPRTKSSCLFSKGYLEKISSLTEDDIEQLISLVDTQPAIRSLVEPTFSQLSRADRGRQLRNRCSADMYVCLKNIFASDALDTILLKEFAALSTEMQDIYRHVSALEASGARVHRQLVLRLLGIEADKVSALLTLMEGLVDEYDIAPQDGLYGWSTRHLVIAQTIARYKYADQDELYSLLRRVISGLNPTIYVELRTLRDICSWEFGIGRLTEDAHQIELYELLIRLAPGERIPRHRLIAKLLRLGRLETASQAIRSAEESVGLDSPINRYKVRLALDRASRTEGILDEDRLAMIREAQRIALRGLEKHPNDKYSYNAYAEVGLALAERSKDASVLDDAIVKMRDAAEKILDPHLGDFLHNFERDRRRFDR